MSYPRFPESIRTMLCATAMLVAALVAFGCGSDSTTKDDWSLRERAERQQSGTNEDLCDLYNFYGDGRCDTFCLDPDPDCVGGGVDAGSPGDAGSMTSGSDSGTVDSGVAPECPQGEGVRYVGSPDECARIFFECEEGERYFDDPECGCGCIEEPACPDPEAPGVEYISQEVDGCALDDFACPSGWDYIAPECGCGCVAPTCTSNEDCDLNEYCRRDAECTANACIDLCTSIECGQPGSALCEVEPNCDDDQYAAEVGLCFVCVDRLTCQSERTCTSDADCRQGYCGDAGLCVHPNCDDGSAVVCDAERPECGPSQVPKVEQGCWVCADARTCEIPAPG